MHAWCFMEIAETNMTWHTKCMHAWCFMENAETNMTRHTKCSCGCGCLECEIDQRILCTTVRCPSTAPFMLRAQFCIMI